MSEDEYQQHMKALDDLEDLYNWIAYLQDIRPCEEATFDLALM